MYEALMKKMDSTDKTVQRPPIESLLSERILILDGAMGTMIQRYALSEQDFRGPRFSDHPVSLRGNNDVLSLTRPDVVEEIHRAYLDAGADIIETNTFSSTTIAQADYRFEPHVEEMNRRSAEIARKAADDFTLKDPSKPRYVAGAIGPTNKTASISPNVNDPGYRAISFDELKTAFKQQMIALHQGGVDMFLIETVIDTLNAKAALMAAFEFRDQTGTDIPVMLSGTITDASGRTLSGQTTEAFLISVSHYPLLSIGLNCALGAANMLPYIKELSRKANCFISVYPNAGLPNEMGLYDQSPESMTAELREFLEGGLANIVGGCCGTSPDHIRAIAHMARNYPPRKRNRQAIHD
ncbi:MAG: hypothetical protein Kow0075_07060 [Salibacteraceae bacterium]